MSTVNPICGTYYGEPQACEVEAVALVATGDAFTRGEKYDTPPKWIGGLLIVAALGFVVLSTMTRRNGRRDN
jgi:hypothetical protein